MSIEALFEKEAARKVQSLEDKDLNMMSILCERLLKLQAQIGNAEDNLQKLKEQQEVIVLTVLFFQ